MNQTTSEEIQNTFEINQNTSEEIQNTLAENSPRKEEYMANKNTFFGEGVLISRGVETDCLPLEETVLSTTINVILEKGTRTPEIRTPSFDTPFEVDNFNTSNFTPSFNGTLNTTPSTSQQSATTPMRGDE